MLDGEDSIEEIYNKIIEYYEAYYGLALNVVERKIRELMAKGFSRKDAIVLLYKEIYGEKILEKRASIRGVSKGILDDIERFLQKHRDRHFFSHIIPLFLSIIVSLKLFSKIVKEIAFHQLKFRSLDKERLMKDIDIKIKMEVLRTVFMSFLFAFMGILLNFIVIISSGEMLLLLVKMICFITLSSMLFISFIWISNNLWIIREYNIFSPLFPLPIDLNLLRLTLLLTILYYGGIPVITMSLISAIIASIKLSNPIIFPIYLMYIVSTFFLSVAIGLKAINIFTLRKIGGRNLRARGMRYVFTVLFTLLIFFQRYFGYLLSNLNNILVSISKPLTGLFNILWFLYPFSATTALEASSIYTVFLSIILSTFYLIFFYKIFGKCFNDFWIKTISPIYIIYKARPLKITSPKLMNPIISLMIKDVKTVLREPATAPLVFLPIVEAIYFLYVFIYEYTNISSFILVAFFHTTFFLASMSIYHLTKFDMKKALILYTLPIDKRTLSLSKTLSIILINLSLLTPISIVLYYFTKNIYSIIGLIGALLSSIGVYINISAYILKHVKPAGSLKILGLSEIILLYIILGGSILIPMILFIFNSETYIPSFLILFIVYIIIGFLRLR